MNAISELISQHGVDVNTINEVLMDYLLDLSCSG